ncbi:hypothetical protein MOQ_009462 [Trypanosoma cruzi marinkellei]|uniref:BRCT domain-containing protein n=1 Tax=Trypanosoma cruzi marinkellei TaxID=85056 RepID=K2MWS7_TRYCR|nr:hypothetical protein MOQ_009462 [Trypanosoma cruzi marinkellei]
MCAESTLPAPRVAYENLLQALLYERNSINDAYDSLLGLVRQNLCEYDTATPATCVLQGLTGMLRFIFERLYQHTSETALTFVKEIGLGSEEDASLEAVAALHDAIKAKMFAPTARMGDVKDRNKHVGEGGEKLRGARQKCCIFAVSSHYEWGAKQEILEALTHKLHHTTVVLQRCEAGKEPSMALQLGCNVLVSPFMPTAPCAIAYATKEKVLQYACSCIEDEIDDELDALLHALDYTARPSTPLTEAATVKSPTNVAPVVSRNVLQGGITASPQNATGVLGVHESIKLQRLENKSLQLYTETMKRSRVDLLSMSPVVLTEPTDFSLQLSQVIQYQRDSPSRTGPALTADHAENSVLDPSQWRFQISNSLRESKDEVIRAICLLGGRVDHSKSYNPQTTHLVVAEGLAERTEKYLSCCAARKYIVSPRYVLESAKRGKWIIDRLHEYDKNPLRHLSNVSSTPPFHGWRVVLFTSTASVDTGIVTVLRAGGCTDITSYIFNTVATPNIDCSCIEQASHLLVECKHVSRTGRFLTPSWFPDTLKRQDHRLFSLELLLHLLCFCPTSMFDEYGRPIDKLQLPPSCLLEIPPTDVCLSGSLDRAVK